MNIPIKYPIAKLLKEKGFDEQCYYYYEHAITEAYNEQDGYSGPFGWEKGETNYQSGFHINNSKYDSSNEAWLLCSAPTIAEVCMWLYEKHGIWIYPFRHDFNNQFYWHIDTAREDEFTSDNVFNSPTEAYTAAIEYTLNNLI